MAAADFWSDRRQAESVGKTVRILKDTIADWEALDAQLEDLDQLRQMAAEEGDAEALTEVEAEVERAMQGIGELGVPHDAQRRGRPQKTRFSSFTRGQGVRTRPNGRRC